MNDTELIDRFKEHCRLNQVEVESPNEEQILLGNFIRKDFLARQGEFASFLESSKSIEFVFTLAESGKIEASIPYLLIEDIIETGSFQVLNHLLPYLDEKSKLWASKMSSKKGVGLILLRSVNLLRRKIVRSEHSKLAGLALLLLTKIFPASERSGVNLKGERNTENKNLTSSIEARDRDYLFVCSLHKLLYISSAKALEKDNWNLLCQSIDKLLDLIDHKAKKQNYNAEKYSDDNNFFSTQHLLIGKSIELQMDDQNFRITLLAQILVLLQDLNCYSNDCEVNGNNKSKLDSLQESWIGDTTKKTFYLISLHHDGKHYFRFLRSVFRNEKNWINWKNLNCPSFEVSEQDINFDVLATTTNEEVANFTSMGDEELFRLWNYSLTDINDRKLKPDIESYINNSLSVDDEYMVNNDLAWRANRLKWKLTL